MALGVRPSPKVQDKMARTNGSGGFFSARDDRTHSTRVSSVDGSFQKRDQLFGKASMNKTATNNLFLQPIDNQHVKDYIAPRGEL